MNYSDNPKPYRPYWVDDFSEPSFFRKVVAVFFPEKCFSCGEVTTCGADFCDDCFVKIQSVIPPICLSCAQQQSFCRCNKNRDDNINGLLAPFYYVGAIREAIHYFKFNDRTYIKSFFVAAMVNILLSQLPNTKFDYVTPVPISKRSYKTRGYNQSELLAREISAVLKIPYVDILEKHKENLPQRELTADKRLKNVRGVYKILDNVECAEFKNKTVLIVDDVITTGATLNECADTLSRLSTYRIYAIAVGETLKDRDN